MNYELAKQLKDEGFPQNTKWAWSVILEEGEIPNKHIFCHAYEKARDYEMVRGDVLLEVVASPTLEELIEACGDGFDNLYKGETWMATDGRGISGNGSTPTEAVARLWLALNKKI